MPFVYRERSVASIQRQAAQTGGAWQGFISDEYTVFRPKKGEDYCIRILPPTWEGAGHYGLPVYAHNRVGPENASMLCLYKTCEPGTTAPMHQRCPICDAVAAMDESGEYDPKDQNSPPRQMAARLRYVVWLLDRKDPTETPQIWAMPWTLDQNIAAISQDKQSGEYHVIDHPTRGRDVYFQTSNDQMMKYLAPQLATKPTTVNPDILEFIEAVPLTSVLIWRTYADMLNIYNGGMDDPNIEPPVRATNGQGRAPVRPVAPRPSAAPPARQAAPAPRPARAPLRQVPMQRVVEAPEEYDTEYPNAEVDPEADPNYELPEDRYEPPPRQVARAPMRAPAPAPRPAPRAPQPNGPAPTGGDRAAELKARYSRQ